MLYPPRPARLLKNSDAHLPNGMYGRNCAFGPNDSKICIQIPR